MPNKKNNSIINKNTVIIGRDIFFRLWLLPFIAEYIWVVAESAKNIMRTVITLSCA